MFALMEIGCLDGPESVSSSPSDPVGYNAHRLKLGYMFVLRTRIKSLILQTRRYNARLFGSEEDVPKAAAVNLSRQENYRWV